MMIKKLISHTSIIAVLSGALISLTVAGSQLLNKIFPGSDTSTPLVEQFKGFTTDHKFMRSYFEIETLNRMLHNPMEVFKNTKPDEVYDFEVSSLDLGRVSVNFQHSNFTITLEDKLAEKRAHISYYHGGPFILSTTDIIFTSTNKSSWENVNERVYEFNSFSELLGSGLVEITSLLEGISYSGAYTSSNNLKTLGEITAPKPATELAKLLDGQIGEQYIEIIQAASLLDCYTFTESTEVKTGSTTYLKDTTTMRFYNNVGRPVAEARTNSSTDFSIVGRNFELQDETIDSIENFCGIN